MRFEDPLFLLLLPLAIIVFLGARHSGGKFLYSDVKKFTQLKSYRVWHPRMILIFLRMSAVVLVVLALARPQAGKHFTEVESEGVDIFLAIDTSGSMQARDFRLGGEPVTRLDVVKKVVADFVKKRPNDRIGLVVFGQDAFTQCPLTLDHGVVLDFLDRLEIGMAGDATAMGSALAVSVNRMKDLKAKSKVVILLTDGVNTAGTVSPQTGAELAKTFGIKTYTIGVGSQGPVPILVDTAFGKRYVHQRLPLDEKTLKEIAAKTQGVYYRAKGTEELTDIYAQIDDLEKTEVKVKEYTEYEERMAWFAIPALLLLLTEILLGHTRLRKIP